MKRSILLLPFMISSLLFLSCKDQKKADSRPQPSAGESRKQPIVKMEKPRDSAVQMPRVESGDESPVKTPEAPALDPAVVTPALEPDTEAFKTKLLRFPTSHAKNFVYVSNRDLTHAAQKIETVIFVIHGIDRNPTVYHQSISEAVTAHNGPSSVSSKTWVIAPFFIQDEDRPLASDLKWSGGLWREGAAAEGFPEATASSFHVLDEMLQALDNPSRFSSLKSITLVGFSAGGQFMQRYMVGTKKPDLMKRFHFRFVVGSPGSYLYLTADRFQTQNNSFSKPKPGNCPGFDDYRYGLNKRIPYLQQSTQGEMISRLKSRSIRFISGDADTSRGGVLDVTCEADLQGSNRYARAQIYEKYARFLGAGDNFKFFTVPRVGHEHSKIFQSTQGQSALFDP